MVSTFITQLSSLLTSLPVLSRWEELLSGVQSLLKALGQVSCFLAKNPYDTFFHCIIGVLSLLCPFSLDLFILFSGIVLYNTIVSPHVDIMSLPTTHKIICYSQQMGLEG